MRLRLLLLLFLAITAEVSAQERAARQMVVSAHPMASEAGRAMLRAGGNAADAAVAAQMVLSVVEPHASGIGGGALLLHWDAATRTLSHIEGLASAPAWATASLVQEADGTRIGPATVARSGRAVGVPGAVAALALLHARHGRLPWPALFAPAIALAEQGFPMPPYLHAVLTARAAPLRAVPAIRAIYFDPEGAPIAIGAALRNPAQAAALRMLAEQGAAALYGGALGEMMRVATDDSAVPGRLSREDFAGYRARDREPVCAEIFARRICGAAPPASGGIAVLQQLATLERLGIARQAPRSAPATHLMIEASRLSRADRVRWIGDPDFVRVPVRGLLDPGYLDARAALIAPGRAMAEAQAGDPPWREGALPTTAAPLAEAATTHLSIIDADGSAIAFTTTNNFNFGAELLGSGITLNNAMTNFSTNPGTAAAPAQNRMQPGKRPSTTMAPTIVFGADGRPDIVLGAGGGAWIIDAVAFALVEMLAWNGDASAAVSRPRLGAQAGRVELEAGGGAEALAPALAAMGHEPRVARINTGLQVLRRIPGGWEGAADPRRDGAARGD